jgi:hypothetical protein
MYSLVLDPHEREYFNLVVRPDELEDARAADR